MGLASLGLTDDELMRMDQEQSIDNYIDYEGERYAYRNSYEAYLFNDNKGDGEGFYMWEFVRENREGLVSVVKWEGMPFEVYTSVVVSPDIVSVFKK
jgi:hypothetical protein